VNVGKALGPDATEIRGVAHGKGVGLLLKTNTALAPRIAGLSSPRVRFVACENTMRRLKIVKDDLLPGTGTVDSGVAEVVRLQEAGWSYIKSGS
jgi:intracellular sulfur oxidation DsrE/DsrF family protein